MTAQPTGLLILRNPTGAKISDPEHDASPSFSMYDIEKMLVCVDMKHLS